MKDYLNFKVFIKEKYFVDFYFILVRIPDCQIFLWVEHLEN